jgi:hypothetical protein
MYFLLENPWVPQKKAHLDERLLICGGIVWNQRLQMRPSCRIRKIMFIKIHLKAGPVKFASDEDQFFKKGVFVLQLPINRTVADYERMADLEFALMVWRQNLKRDLTSTTSQKVCTFCSPIHVKYNKASVLLPMAILRRGRQGKATQEEFFSFWLIGSGFFSSCLAPLASPNLRHIQQRHA